MFILSFLEQIQICLISYCQLVAAVSYAQR